MFLLVCLGTKISNLLKVYNQFPPSSAFFFILCTTSLKSHTQEDGGALSSPSESPVRELLLVSVFLLLFFSVFEVDNEETFKNARFIYNVWCYTVIASGEKQKRYTSDEIQSVLNHRHMDGESEMKGVAQVEGLKWIYLKFILQRLLK